MKPDARKELQKMSPKTKYDYLIGMIESSMEEDENIVYTEIILEELLNDLGVKFYPEQP